MTGGTSGECCIEPVGDIRYTPVGMQAFCVNATERPLWHRRLEKSLSWVALTFLWDGEVFAVLVISTLLSPTRPCNALLSRVPNVSPLFPLEALCSRSFLAAL